VGRAEAHTGLGWLDEARGDWDKALEFATDQQRDLFRIKRAVVQLGLGAHREATAEASDVASNQPNPERIFDAACICSLASAAATIDNKLSKADRDTLVEDYAARAIVYLGKAQEGGVFKKPENIEALKIAKELDPLRSRKDFKKLLDHVAMEVKQK